MSRKYFDCYLVHIEKYVATVCPKNILLPCVQKILPGASLCLRPPAPSSFASSPASWTGSPPYLLSSQALKPTFWDGWFCVHHDIWHLASQLIKILQSMHYNALGMLSGQCIDWLQQSNCLALLIRLGLHLKFLVAKTILAAKNTTVKVKTLMRPERQIQWYTYHETT